MNKDVFKINFKQIIAFIKKHKGFGFLTSPAKSNLERKADETQTSSITDKSESRPPSYTIPNGDENKNYIKDNQQQPTDLSEHPIPISYTPNVPVNYRIYQPKDYDGDGGSAKIISKLDEIVQNLKTDDKSDQYKIILQSIQEVIRVFSTSRDKVSKETSEKLEKIVSSTSDQNSRILEILNQTRKEDTSNILVTIREEVTKVLKEIVKNRETENELMETDIRQSSTLTNDYIKEVSEYLKKLDSKLSKYEPISKSEIDAIIKKNSELIQSFDNSNYSLQMNNSFKNIEEGFKRMLDSIPKNINVQSTASIDTSEVQRDMKKISENMLIISDQLNNSSKKPPGGSPGAPAVMSIDTSQVEQNLKKVSNDLVALSSDLKNVKQPTIDISNLQKTINKLDVDIASIQQPKLNTSKLEAQLNSMTDNLAKVNTMLSNFKITTPKIDVSNIEEDIRKATKNMTDLSNTMKSYFSSQPPQPPPGSSLISTLQPSIGQIDTSSIQLSLDDVTDKLSKFSKELKNAKVPKLETDELQKSINEVSKNIKNFQVPSINTSELEEKLNASSVAFNKLTRLLNGFELPDLNTSALELKLSSTTQSMENTIDIMNDSLKTALDNMVKLSNSIRTNVNAANESMIDVASSIKNDLKKVSDNILQVSNNLLQTSTQNASISKNVMDNTKKILDKIERPEDQPSTTLALRPTSVSLDYDEFMEKLLANSKIKNFLEKSEIVPSNIDEAKRVIQILNTLQTLLNNLSESSNVSNTELVAISAAIKKLTDDTNINLSKITINQETNQRSVNNLIKAIQTSNTEVSGIKNVVDQISRQNLIDNETTQRIRNLVSTTPDTTNQEAQLRRIEQEFQNVKLDRDTVLRLINEISSASLESKRIMENIINRMNEDDNFKRSLLDELDRKNQALSIRQDTQPLSEEVKQMMEILTNINTNLLNPTRSTLIPIRDIDNRQAIDTINSLNNARAILNVDNEDEEYDNYIDAIDQPSIEAPPTVPTLPGPIPPIYIEAPPTVPPNETPEINNNLVVQPLPVNQPIVPGPIPQAIQLINTIDTGNEVRMIDINRPTISNLIDNAVVDDLGYYGGSEARHAQSYKKLNVKPTITKKESKVKKFYEVRKDDREKKRINLLEREKSNLRFVTIKDALEKEVSMRKLSPLLNMFSNIHNNLNRVHQKIIYELNEIDRLQINDMRNVVGGNNNVAMGGSLETYIKTYNGKFKSNLNAGQLRDRLNNQSHIIGTILDRQSILYKIMNTNSRANKMVLKELSTRLMNTANNHLFYSETDRYSNSFKQCPNCGDLYSERNKRIQLECKDSICNACYHIFGPICFLQFSHNGLATNLATPTQKVVSDIYLPLVLPGNSKEILSNVQNLFTKQEIIIKKERKKLESREVVRAAAEEIIKILDTTLTLEQNPENIFNINNEALLQKLANKKNTVTYTTSILLSFTRKQRIDLRNTLDYLIGAMTVDSPEQINPELFSKNYTSVFGSSNNIPDDLNPFIHIIKNKSKTLTGINLADNSLPLAAQKYLEEIKKQYNNYRSDPIYNIPLINTIDIVNNQSGLSTSSKPVIKRSEATNNCGYCNIPLKDTWYNIKHVRGSCNLCEYCAGQTSAYCKQCTGAVLEKNRQYDPYFIEESKGKIEGEKNILDILTEDEKRYLQKKAFISDYPNQPISLELQNVTNPWYNEETADQVYQIFTRALAATNTSKDSVDNFNIINPNPQTTGKEQPPSSIINDQLVPKADKKQDQNVKIIPSDYSKVSMGYNPVISEYENQLALIKNKGHILEINPSISEFDWGSDTAVPLIEDKEELEEEAQNTLQSFINEIKNYQKQMDYKQDAQLPSQVPISATTGEGIEKKKINDHIDNIRERYKYVGPSKRLDHIAKLAESSEDIKNHSTIAKGIVDRFIKDNKKDFHMGDIKFNERIHTLKKIKHNYATKEAKIPNCDHCGKSLFNSRFHVYKNQDTDPIHGGVICNHCFENKTMLPNSRKMIDKSNYEDSYESNTNTAKGIIKKIHNKAIEPFYQINEEPKTLWENFKETIPLKYDVNNVIDKLNKDIILTSDRVSETDLDYYVIGLAYNTFRDKATNIMKANLISIGCMFARQNNVEFAKLFRVAFTKFKSFENLKQYIIDYPNVVIQFLPHNHG